MDLAIYRALTTLSPQNKLRILFRAVFIFIFQQISFHEQLKFHAQLN